MSDEDSEENKEEIESKYSDEGASPVKNNGNVAAILKDVHEDESM
jgi:hypothetical protein